MINFSKYNVILWDFDGVLMDSMPVRDKGFEMVLKEYPKEQLERLMVYHRNNGGISRYVKFRYFFEQIRNEAVTEEQIKVLAASFSVVMRQELTNPLLLIEDSLSFVKRSYASLKMHIVSGSDEQELNYLCGELGIAKYFRSIHGSPVAKNVLVKNLLASYDPRECVLIGDSVNDLEAARVNGITFIGYNNPLLESLSDHYITSFSKL
jgi:phosphoglycolate phosphatase-like HAD superfamily hydrolase